MEQQLLDACWNGHTEKVKQLLENNQKININCENNDGETPLYIACEKGHIRIVVELLSKGKRVDINKANIKEVTPFLIACYKGHIEIVKLLLKERKIDASKANKYKKNPFWVSCQKGHIEIVELLLLKYKPDEINKRDKYNQTPFYIACYYGHIEIVKLLLNDNRVDVNKANKCGWTPFWVACEKGHIEIVEYLLVSERKINFTEINNLGERAIDIARKRNCLKIVELLESFERDPKETRVKLKLKSKLLDACESGNVEEVNQVLNNTLKIDINCENEFGETPFYIACENGHLEIVKLLLNKKADINKTNKKGQTPFYIACEKRNLEFVELFLNEGRIDINKANNEGQTPFHIACLNGDIDIVKYILANEKEINFTAINNLGERAIDIARKRNETKIVELLESVERDAKETRVKLKLKSELFSACESGNDKEAKRLLLIDDEVDVNNPHFDGTTPFWIACEKGHIKVVELLLSDHKVDINKPNKLKKTPLYIACYSGQMKIVKLLLEDKRVKIHKSDKNDITPLYIACEKGHLEIVKLFLNDERIDINKPNVDGETLLFIACYYGHIEIVKLLLNDDRVDVNQAMNDGHDERVDINKGNKNGETPFWISCSRGHARVVEFLLNDERVNINKADIDDQTPFFITCAHGHIGVVKCFLVNQKSDVNFGAGIEIARERNELEIVELLEAFEMYPNETRSKLRKELGLPDVSVNSFREINIFPFAMEIQVNPETFGWCALASVVFAYSYFYSKYSGKRRSGFHHDDPIENLSHWYDTSNWKYLLPALLGEHVLHHYVKMPSLVLEEQMVRNKTFDVHSRVMGWLKGNKTPPSWIQDDFQSLCQKFLGLDQKKQNDIITESLTQENKKFPQIRKLVQFIQEEEKEQENVNPLVKTEKPFVLVADTGDGARTTRLIGGKLKELRSKENFHLLIGGDVVYPSPDHDLLQRKFITPFFQADDNYKEIEMKYSLIPGNHDSHDNAQLLNQFAFLNWDRWKQLNISHLKNGIIDIDPNVTTGHTSLSPRSSYEAIKQGNKLYCLLDGRVSGEIDIQQFYYFYHLFNTLEEKERENENENEDKNLEVILVIHQPFWLVDGYRPILMMLYKYLKERNLLKLVIAGDLHCFLYHKIDRIDHIVVGCGGAFLHFPHHFKDLAPLFIKAVDNPNLKGRCVQMYPSEEVSKKLLYNWRTWIECYLELFLWNGFWIVGGIDRLIGPSTIGLSFVRGCTVIPLKLWNWIAGTNFLQHTSPTTNHDMGSILGSPLTQWLIFVFGTSFLTLGIIRFNSALHKDVVSSLLRSEKYKGFLELPKHGTWRFHYHDNENENSKWQIMDSNATLTFQSQTQKPGNNFFQSTFHSMPLLLMNRFQIFRNRTSIILQGIKKYSIITKQTVKKFFQSTFHSMSLFLMNCFQIFRSGTPIIFQGIKKYSTITKQTLKKKGKAAFHFCSQLTTPDLKLAMDVTFFGLSIYAFTTHGHNLTWFMYQSFGTIFPAVRGSLPIY